MGYFQVRYNSRVIIYERKMFIRLATDVSGLNPVIGKIYVEHLFSVFNNKNKEKEAGNGPFKKNYVEPQ